MGSQTRTTSLDAKCRAIIETSHPLFVIHTNHVSTLPDTTIYTLCERVYNAALTNLSLTAHSNLLSLRDILSATFDPDHRAFVLDDVPETKRILAVLDADARACIFAQAIAGIVYFLRVVAECRSPLTAERVAAKLRRFEEGEERKAMLAAIEMSPMWSDCFEKAQIGEMIMRAACGTSIADVTTEVKNSAAVDVIEVNGHLVNEPVFNDGPHLNRSLGVPDVFKIMALN